MQTLAMFHQFAPAATTVAALALPWTAVFLMHALSIALSGASNGKWQARG